MKKPLLLISVLVMMSAYSQVGINTETPKATLDVVGKPTNASVADGIIIPRISGDELTAKDLVYGTEQTGTIIYATSAASTPDIKTAEVTAEGFYYFDGGIWKTVGGGSDINLYKDDGILTGFRTVSMPSGTNLKFEAEEHSGFQVSTGSGIISFTGREQGTRINLNTIQINSQINLGTEGRFSNIKLNTSGDTASNILLQPDTTHTNVGIGTFDPTAKLHTNGTLRHEALTVNNDNTKFMTTDANGNVETRSSASFLPVVLAGGNLADATASSATISSINNNVSTATLATRTFTITKQSLVTFSFSTGVQDVVRSNGGTITDGLSKLIGARLEFTALPSGSPYSIGSFVRSSVPFTNVTNGDYASGFFYLNGSRTAILQPGTYSVAMVGYVFAFDNVQGVRATFNGTADQLDIVAIPLQ